MTSATISLALRRIARTVAGAHKSCHVDVVAGDSAPQLAGESYYWETRGGRRINHPGAYARSGWSNMSYVSSSLRVEVGSDWLAAQAAS